MKCRVYSCWREAAPGSEFCRVKHGWWEDEPTVPELERDQEESE